MSDDVTDKDTKRSVSSVVALIIAIIGLLLSPVPIINNFAFFLAIIALVFGFVGLSATRKHRRKGRKTAVISLILAVLACVVVLASQSFYSNGLKKVGKDIQNSADKATGKKTDEVLGKDVDVTLGSFTITAGQYTTDTVLPVKITNKTDTSKSFSVQIEAVDQSGSRIDDDTVYANNLGSKQSQDFKAFQYVQSDKLEALKTAKFKVANVSEY